VLFYILALGCPHPKATTPTILMLEIKVKFMASSGPSVLKFITPCNKCNERFSTTGYEVNRIINDTANLE